MTAHAFILLAGLVAGAAPRPLPPAVTSKINQLFADYDRPGSAGFAVGVIRDGKLIFARGYGQANLDYNEPITPKTAFHLASLSKQFTAAAIALLILEGKLSLETPVVDFVPELAHFHADLRLKHLLYFTSGLPEYSTRPRAGGKPWFSPYYFTTDEAIGATLSAGELEFAPGTRWQYSNVNYMLLTRVVEKVSGLPFGRFLEERVFAPLGMRNSHLDSDATRVVPGRATGYVRRDDQEARAELASGGIQVEAGPGYIQLLRNSPHYGGSGVFSSIEDLAKWDQNFTTRTVGGPRFTEQMQQRVTFEHDKDNDAFGLVWGEFEGRPMLWFSGKDLDGSSYMARLPGEHLTVICLSNLPKADAEGKARQVLSLVLAPGTAR